LAYQPFELAEERGREIHQIGRKLSDMTGQAQSAYPGGAKKSLEFKNYDRLLEEKRLRKRLPISIF
jgi:hypothetical protein